MDPSAPLPLTRVSDGPEVRFYAERAMQSGGPALVLGAANGRIAWEIGARGIPAVAVDPSAVMVKAAEERRSSAPVEVSQRLRLMFADLRSLRLSERFKLVAAPQNAASLMASLDDLDALFATAKHHLAQDGVFAFDVLNPAAQESWAPAGDSEAAARPDPVRLAFVPHLRERRRSAPGPSHQGIRRWRVRPFYPEEVDAALQRTGWVALERYGDFAGKPFDLQDPIQVLVAGAADLPRFTRR